METMRHEVYKITQWVDWIKASVFALITLRRSSKGSSVRNTIRDRGVKLGSFENKKAWRAWLQVACQVVMEWEGFNEWDWEGFMDIRNMGINSLSTGDFHKLTMHVLIFFIQSFVTHLGYYPSPILCPLILANQRCTKHRKKFATSLF
jgi:hypothetical protein